jgi:hypothetical protein
VAGTGGEVPFSTDYPAIEGLQTKFRELGAVKLTLSPARLLVEFYNADGDLRDSIQLAGAASRIITDSNLLSSVKVFPNPHKAGVHGGNVQFDGLPARSTVKIFTVSGRLVRELPAGESVWDLRNARGQLAASGIYLFLIELDGQKHRGKLAVVR